MTAERRLADGITTALASLGVVIESQQVQLVRPARLEHGDWSTNVALVVAKSAGRPPREMAADLAAALLAQRIDEVETIEVAGPGFVNFKLAVSWLHDALVDVLEGGEDGYATPDLGAGERVQIEFVSANPTGPIHVGNGWLGSYGDALGRVMTRCGWDVQREFYVNDTGGQIRLLGESLLRAPPGRGRARGGLPGRVRHLAGRRVRRPR